MFGKCAKCGHEFQKHLLQRKGGPRPCGAEMRGTRESYAREDGNRLVRYEWCRCRDYVPPAEVAHVI